MSRVKTPIPPPIKDKTLGFSVGTGVIVWAIHLMAVYVFVALACGRGWLEFGKLSISGVNLILIILTIPAVILIVVAGIVSYRGWRKLREHKGVGEDSQHKRYQFMLLSGAILNLLFSLLVIITLVPSFILPPCQ